jgi:hypothetical protein
MKDSPVPAEAVSIADLCQAWIYIRHKLEEDCHLATGDSDRVLSLCDDYDRKSEKLFAELNDKAPKSWEDIGQLLALCNLLSSDGFGEPVYLPALIAKVQEGLLALNAASATEKSAEQEANLATNISGSTGDVLKKLGRTIPRIKGSSRVN